MSSTVPARLPRQTLGMAEQDGVVTRAETRIPRWLERVLGIPLAWKLAGANAIVVAAALITATALHGSTPRDREMLLVLALALAGSFLVNLGLVVLALRPLRTL